jgi:hypothetical protein
VEDGATPGSVLGAGAESPGEIVCGCTHSGDKITLAGVTLGRTLSKLAPEFARVGS